MPLEEFEQLLRYFEPSNFYLNWQGWFGVSAHEFNLKSVFPTRLDVRVLTFMSHSSFIIEVIEVFNYFWFGVFEKCMVITRYNNNNNTNNKFI